MLVSHHRAGGSPDSQVAATWPSGPALKEERMCLISEGGIAKDRTSPSFLPLITEL